MRARNNEATPAMTAPSPDTALNDAIERIGVARAELDRHIRERERCSLAAMSGDKHLAALEQLRAEREEAIAIAFADDVRPAIADIDARIAEHENQHAEVVRARDVARAAVAVLDRRIAGAQSTLTEHIDTARELALQALAPEFDAAEEAFAQAFEALAGPVARLMARAAIWQELTGKPVPVVERREDIRAALREIKALRVRWDYSPLRDPALASRYDEADYKGHQRFGAAWLDPHNASFAQAETAELRTKLHLDELKP